MNFFFVVLYTIIICIIFVAGSSDEAFSLALYHFNHTLVTSDLPSPVLQVGERFVLFRALVHKDRLLTTDSYIKP